jgi:hypothetical protein
MMMASMEDLNLNMGFKPWWGPGTPTKFISRGHGRGTHAEESTLDLVDLDLETFCKEDP